MLTVLMSKKLMSFEAEVSRADVERKPAKAMIKNFSKLMKSAIKSVELASSSFEFGKSLSF